ncbi:sigma-E factor negative regulatory protein [Thioalkalivibrio sp. HK1]|uniref:sigma-E factor negative regulatory protein n=1 Tax=Thioalkalivibrio sp. HK1 TaxID=1469245 RepID=UPI00046EA89F|nr:sigma-E factor negative regulatory protein [Thioalkalivibrio sp. HK1]
MKYEDRSDILEDISAFMDDELPPEEGGALVDRLLEDETLRRRWASYHLIGDILRGTECRVQMAIDDGDCLSARIAEEIEEIEKERSDAEADAPRSFCRGSTASPMPIHPRRRSKHSHPSTPSEPKAFSSSGSCASSPKTSPSKPSRMRFFTGPVLATSIAIIAIMSVEMIPSSEKRARHQELSSASMDPAPSGDTMPSEEVIAPTLPTSSNPSLDARSAYRDSGYRNLYLLRRAGYRGGELRAMQAYSSIVGDQAQAAH